MHRREFLAKAGIAATWAGIAISIGACSDDGSDSVTDPGNQGEEGGDVQGVVGGSHSHDGAVVTAAEIMAGNAVQLTLTGSGHAHTLSLSAEQVLAIGGGETVTQTSSTDQGHSHPVTFN
jgi:hypothetical protein